MLTLPDKWDYSFGGLVQISKEGKSSIRTLINELKDSKYIKISQSRNEKGYYQYKYTVYRKPYEEIQKNEFHPTPDYRSTDSRTSENLPQINTNKEIDINDNIDKTKFKS